ncbi:MAG: hypothetical protein H6607_07855 [Flavobacteriales bacterium]|nr:hypothetical protein [Flavobacteriales bacterium]
MSTDFLEIRPRFKKLSPENREVLQNRLNDFLSQPNEQLFGSMINNHATINIPVEQQHFWSPQLGLSFEDHENGTIIRGLYGPKPVVWLMFMFLYFFLGFVVLVVLIVAISRQNLGLSTYILWVVPFLLGGILTLWFSGKAGKKIGHNQIYQIHDQIKPLILKDAVDYEDW